MEKKRIVFVLNEYNGHGGAQRVASILTEEFRSDGHDVRILSINEQKNAESYFAEDVPITVLHDDGYRAGQPKALSNHAKQMRIRTVLKEVNRRKQLSKRRNDVKKYFDQFGDEEVIVIVIQVWGMQWLEPVLYRKNVHVIGQSHESYNASRASQRYKRILKYYRQVEKFLLLTHKDADQFEAQGFSNTGVLYNPTPFREKVDADILYQNKTIVSSGRLVEGKGFDELIEAFSMVTEELPGWKLKIYGDGPLEESLQAMIDVMGLGDRVHLMGQTVDIQVELKSGSIFALASKAEGLPMSLIEAQAVGLPCVSTDCAPGIREIIADYRNGYIAPVGEIHLFARHLKRLALNRSIYQSFSENSFESSHKFERTFIKEQWYKLFDEVGGTNS